MHLKPRQLQHIEKILIENSPKDHNLIRRSYILSKSTYLRLVNLIKNQKYSLNPSTWFSRRGIKVEESERKLVQSTLEPPKYPITINKIQTSIKNNIRRLYNSTIFKKLIKWELKYSYKKGCSVLYNIKLIELYLSKDCFCSELLKQINEKTLILNIDESSINRTIKQNYSWLPIERSSPIINDKFLGKWTLILAISNNKSWFGMTIKNTVNSRIFAVFLILLNKILK